MSPELLHKPTEQHELSISKLNHEFENLSPTQRIARANEIFDGNIVLATSFGPTAPVLLTAAKEAVPDITVVTMRHGHESPDTLQHADWYSRELDLDLQVFRAEYRPIPDESTSEFQHFQYHAKREPFERMLGELQPKAFLSGAMHWQTDARREFQFVEKRGDVIAINPVIDLTEADVDDFFAQSRLPKNEHYFDPTKGSNQRLECGLNTAKDLGQLARSAA